MQQLLASKKILRVPSQWETHCGILNSQLEETNQGSHDNLQKIEQLEQWLMEKDFNPSTANTAQGTLENN